jgi:hypothetical protein
MADPPLNPIADGLAALATSRSPEDLLRLLTPDGQQSAIVAALAAHAQKIATLEVAMSDTTDAIAELNTETDALAARIDAVIGSIEGVDDATAAELRAVSSRLRGLAADPANPVPPVEPTP